MCVPCHWLSAPPLGDLRTVGTTVRSQSFGRKLAEGPLQQGRVRGG